MAGQDYRIKFKSDIVLVKNIVNDALEYIISVFPDISGDSRFDIKLVLNELLLNAVSHGNNEDINKEVSLTLKTCADSITIIVADEGEGFDYSSDSSLLGQDELLSERGRGIHLIKYLTDEIYFNEFGNEIKICKKVRCVVN